MKGIDQFSWFLPQFVYQIHPWQNKQLEISTDGVSFNYGAIEYVEEDFYDVCRSQGFPEASRCNLVPITTQGNKFTILEPAVV